MALLNWFQKSVDTPQKGVIYEISDIDTFIASVYWARHKDARSPSQESIHVKAMSRVLSSHKDGLLLIPQDSSDMPADNLFIASGDIVKFQGMGGDGRPYFTLAVGEAWKDIIISLDTPEDDFEPDKLGLSKYISPEMKILTPTVRQRSLAR